MPTSRSGAGVCASPDERLSVRAEACLPDDRPTDRRTGRGNQDVGYVEEPLGHENLSELQYHCEFEGW